MRHHTVLSTIFTTVLFILLCCSQALGAPKHLFKIASLAPSGSVWVEQFKKFGAEVTEKTGGEVGFRVYPGGVMGDDQAMYRKIRVGQLQGGGFTMTGISSVVPDFRVLSIPFLFNSYEEIDYVKKGLLPEFKERFEQKGMILVGMTEVGFIYAMSTKQIHSYEKLKATKNWIPSGDPVSKTFLTKLDITPIQLTIPDVLSSLQSGLVETVYNSLYGSIIMQWFTKAKYIVDFPYGYAYGVFALSEKKFNKLSDSQKKAVFEAAEVHFPILLASTRKSNLESRQVLIDRGAEFMALDKPTIQLLREKRDQAIGELVPRSMSKKIHDRTAKLIEEFRNKKQ